MRKDKFYDSSLAAAAITCVKTACRLRALTSWRKQKGASRYSKTDCLRFTRN